MGKAADIIGGVLIAGVAGVISYGGVAPLVRDPVQPPTIEYRISPNQVAQYESAKKFLSLYDGKPVELTLKPVFVHLGEDSLEIGMQQGDKFIRAKSEGISNSILQARLGRHVSPEKLIEVHDALKKGIASGGLENIMVRGTFEGNTLKVYSLSIAGKDYSLLK